jgi:hypothetical protein
MQRIFFLFFVAILLLGIAHPYHTYAQDNAGLTLVPAFIEEGAKPGDTLTQTLKVTNESAEEKEYYIYKRNIKGVETGGVPIFDETGDTETGYEIAEWITLPAEKVKVPANDFIEIEFSIVVPAEASPGSHFGGVFISQEPPKLRANGAGVGYEVVSVISIRIEGKVSDSARIRSFSTNKLFFGSKNVDFTAQIQNQGNILIRPYGPVTITNMFGSDPVSFTVNENRAGVFPGTMRDIAFSWSEKGIGFGRYQAVLALTYDGDGGQKTIDASLIFWVFPAKIILTICGVLFVVLVGGYMLTRYYISQAIMRAGGGRRIAPQRYRKQVGISRFAFVSIALMAMLVVFLIVILIFFA